MSYVSIVVTPQNVIKAVAADALLSEVYSARTPLKIALGYVISLTSSYLLLLATLFAWITEESKQHIDKFMRSAPVELQCAWLATLQPLILLQWLKRCWWPATKQARLKVVFYTAAATALAGSTILPSGIFLSTAATVWTALLCSISDTDQIAYFLVQWPFCIFLVALISQTIYHRYLHGCPLPEK